VSLLSRKTLTKKLLQSKKFRAAYVFEHIKRSIPFQVRTMRTEREWSQAKAGEEIGKPQNVISRLESPAYGKLTLQTLLDIAKGFDVGLIIKFVPFSRLVREYEDVSFDALSAKSVSDKEEAQRIQDWATEDVGEFVVNANISSSDNFIDSFSVELPAATSQEVLDIDHFLPKSLLGTTATKSPITSEDLIFVPVVAQDFTESYPM